MKKLLILLLVISGIAKAQTFKNVDAATFKSLIAEKKGVLIDLRTTEEINSKGQIKGAQQIDYLTKNIETILNTLDKKKTYLIYCASGGRSGDCGELMQKLGFKEVINLEKGFTDWKNKGFEIEKK